jgi:Ca2+-transporting ATPase
MLGAVAVGLAAHVAIIYVPFLQRVFGTAPLSLAEWGMALAGTLVVMAGVEVWKWRLRATERVS